MTVNNYRERKKKVLFFLTRQPAYAIGFTPGTNALLQPFFGIGGHFIFEAAAETLELLFHIIHTLATSVSSSSTAASSLSFRLCSASTFRPWAISSGVAFWRISSSCRII